MQRMFLIIRDESSAEHWLLNDEDPHEAWSHCGDSAVHWYQHMDSSFVYSADNVRLIIYIKEGTVKVLWDNRRNPAEGLTLFGAAFGSHRT